ncbi:hypothetical protein [Sphingomonas sp. dw_22]|uniref:hypothetical protein n=1 Tax=Sphingomonas sp. dw_22 TaxID=2721175 RepID=UPI001BD39E1D
MKWFGRKSARDAARLPLSRAGSFVGLGEWPRSYEAQVREGYCQNPVAQRAVKLVAEGVGGTVLTGSDPALVALVAARSGGQALTETVAAQLLLHGKARACLELDRSVGGCRRSGRDGNMAVDFGEDQVTAKWTGAMKPRPPAALEVDAALVMMLMVSALTASITSLL